MRLTKFISLSLFIATMALLVFGTLMSTRSASAGQGKGGAVVAKPAPSAAPKKPATRKTAPALTRVDLGLLKTVTLPMTPEAKQMQLQGGASAPRDGEPASIQVMIDESGRVTKAEPTNGHPSILHAALANALEQHFSPAIRNGRRVKSLGSINYVFTDHPNENTSSTNNASGSGTAVVRPCTPAPSGLENWYSAEDNANDALGAGNGILKSGAGFASGKVGRAFSFNGIDQYVSVPNYKPTAPSFFTIAAWVNFSTLVRGSVIASKYDGQYHGWLLQSLENGNFQFKLLREWEVLKAAYGSNGPIATNTWVHVAGTYDGANITLYINGSVAGSAEFGAGYRPSAVDLTIGRASWHDIAFFPGKIDEVQFFNRALSASEIRSIVDAGDGGNCHTDSR